MRVGVVGLGFGAAVHVPAFRRVADVEIVAIAGSSAERAAEIARELGVPYGCGSIEELLERGVDAITIAIPPAVQPELAAVALTERVAVFAEKPLARTTEAAWRLVATAGATTTAVDFEFAELATFRALREAVGGEEVRSLHVTWQTRARPGVVRAKWKDAVARGGGVGALLGTHVLYLLEWLLGPVDTIAVVESSASATTFTCTAGGVDVFVELDNSSPEQRHEWRAELRDRVLLAQNLGLDAVSGFRLLDGSGRVLAQEPPDAHPDGRVAAVASLAARFVDAVATGSAIRPAFEEGARVQQLLAAIQEARVIAR